MDLTIYDVLLGPVLTDKAYKLNKKFKKLVLKVHPQSNKSQIKEALEKLFEVKVDKIRTLVRKAKSRKVGRRTVYGSQMKKAVITLAEGYSLDLLDQSGKMVVPGEQGKRTEKNKETEE